jgi:ribosomal protein S18 acetylase RimI-like enzyme
MFEIRSLEDFPAAALEAVDADYTSPAKYAVHKHEDEQRTTIEIELVALEQPYAKHWQPFEAEEVRRYQEYARTGLSLGAYDGERLIGIALTEPRSWNGTLWVWEFYIDTPYRGRGIGRRLMEGVVAIARQRGFRAVGLETQNTNVPAIRFYRKLGFEIEGIDLSLYSNRDVSEGEVALFMKRKISPAGGSGR